MSKLVACIDSICIDAVRVDTKKRTGYLTNDNQNEKDLRTEQQEAPKNLMCMLSCISKEHPPPTC